VHALNAGVDSQTAGGRELMRGVAAQDHTALRESFGHGHVHPPQSGAFDVHIEVWYADRRAHPLPQAVRFPQFV
jgi:hypothetical protein